MRITASFRPRLGHLALAVFAQACATAPTGKSTPAVRVTPAVTTIVVVRHAEKGTDDPRDPDLSTEGLERAEALSALLKDAGVKAIYTTQYKRTRQTAEPLARQFGISIIERPVSSANAATYARDLAQEILVRNAGESVLIVGHSNTVPEIVTALSGQPVPAITEAEYDHVFMVTVPALGAARLKQSRYGRPGA